MVSVNNEQSICKDIRINYLNINTNVLFNILKLFKMYLNAMLKVNIQETHLFKNY